MYKILSDRLSYAVIMYTSMYLNLEGYFSLNINLRFCEVKFKPLDISSFVMDFYYHC